jgi:small subunit ribosomal protein S6
MAANVYECMFLLDTNKVAGDLPGAAGQLHNLLEKNSAEILASRPWDERRLAYAIGNHKKGLYYLTYFRTEAKNLVKLKQDMSLMDLVLRSMILKIDPKLVDTMLAIARDEHALVALQGYRDEPAEGEESRKSAVAAGAEVAVETVVEAVK